MKFSYQALLSVPHMRAKIAHEPAADYTLALSVLTGMCTYATESHCIVMQKKHIAWNLVMYIRHNDIIAKHESRFLPRRINKHNWMGTQIDVTKRLWA